MGNSAVSRVVGEQRYPAPAHPLATVQRAPAAAPADPEVRHIHDFVTETLSTSDRLIAEAKSFRWRFTGKTEKQKQCDELGRALDTAEHMIYRQFRSDPEGKKDNPRNTGLKELLDKIQKRHLAYVEILHAGRLRPFGADVDPDDSEALDELSGTWSKVVAGQAISTSTKPRPFGEDRDPAPLKGFDTQMLSAHARLLSRQRGRALVGDLASTPAPTGVNVIPYHPEQLEFMGGATGAGAEALADDAPKALARGDKEPGAGSSSLIAVPHDFKDSEGAKKDESISPAFLVYGHELIHAQHNKHGINVRDIDNEEKATVSGTEKSGLLHMEKGLRPTTEEMLRDEHNLPRRGGYT
ncbi:M91 family zinc metallopeptidase [Streptomyces sp. NRRL F-5126]|uniref:M91 family zinc metallopeptidase n=1 Tax=Streptomyces sp. NRRL F-5126 TaxID=1463857 RepID=UPI00131C51D8|nr:M91 family zinc metallopeptidase [Streptomyces sp. NRRL F-5126]